LDDGKARILALGYGFYNTVINDGHRVGGSGTAVTSTEYGGSFFGVRRLGGEEKRYM